MSENYKFFQHKNCEYFPCHKVEASSTFNCLFCFCPLYGLGNKCGGNFSYTENGIKDCSNCLIPHSSNGYSHVISKMPEVLKLASINTDKSHQNK